MKTFKYYAMILIILGLLLTSLIKAQPYNVDCIGNSITANGYPEVADFWAVQDGENFRVFNYGVPGAGIIVNDYTKTPEFTETIQRKSPYIIIKLGSNDISGYRDMDNGWRDFWNFQYRELVKKYKNMNGSTVFLGTIIYRLSSNPNDIPTVDKMNEEIRKIASEFGLKVVDFNSAIGTTSEYFLPDGVHPTTEGKYKLARTAFDFLKANIESVEEVILYGGINNGCVDLQWQRPSTTPTKYTLNVVEQINGNTNEWNLDIPIYVLKYTDCNIQSGAYYIYTIKSYTNGILTAKSGKFGIQIPANLSVDDEYWSTVEEYNNEQKSGWFGCSFKNPVK